MFEIYDVGRHKEVSMHKFPVSLPRQPSTVGVSGFGFQKVKNDFVAKVKTIVLRI